MYEVQRLKRTQVDQQQMNPEQKQARPKNTQSTTDALRLPLYAQAHGNLLSPRLRLPVAQRVPLEGKSLRKSDEPLHTTSLPDTLKRGMEDHSGLPLDGVQVHYNSPKPSQVQALAYTQGKQIHIGPGQEQHLAHEAWHVVQQMQGRVQPTQQAKGIAINDDSVLEREADAMGAKAVAGQLLGTSMDPSAREVSREKGYGNAQGTHQAAVQRKVGFEFETGWSVRKGGELLEKKDQVGTGVYSGFNIESDDDGRIEFVIYPPLEISSKLPTEIASIFGLIELYCQQLEEVAKNHRTVVVEEPIEKEPVTDKEAMMEEDSISIEEDSSSAEPEEPDYEYHSFPLSESTWMPLDRAYTVYPSSTGDVSAHPQITAGLTLGQIAQLPAYNEAKPLPGLAGQAITATPEALVPRVNATTIAAAGFSIADIGGSISNEMKGLVTLAAKYIKDAAARPYVDYPKLITDTFLLSRTRFDTLFKQIPEWRYFARNPTHWVNLVMRVASLDNPDLPVYVHGILRDANVSLEEADPFGPTRRAWLEGMTKGLDLLSKATNVAFESMGELGDKTEMVATGDGKTFTPGGIFEIRAGQTGSVEYKEWGAYALQAAQFLMNMQRDPQGILLQLQRNEQLRSLLRKH